MNMLLETGASANCLQAVLEVNASNVKAQGLYRKYGFTKVGVRKDYYTNPLEDGDIMVKVL